MSESDFLLAREAVEIRLGYVAPATIEKWIHQGIMMPDGSRVRLRTLRFRNHQLSTVEFVDEFLFATISAPPQKSSPRYRYAPSAEASRA